MSFFSGTVKDRQILIEVWVGPPSADGGPTPSGNKPYVALVDTGATNTCISPTVVEDLQLRPEGMQFIHTPAGVADMKVYHVGLHILIATREDGVVKWDKHSKANLAVTESSQAPNHDVLPGMDVLALCSLFVAGDAFTLGY